MARPIQPPTQVNFFSTWLDEEIGRAGLTLTDLARRSGITYSYLQALRHGRKTHPSAELVEKLIAALNADRNSSLRALNLPQRTYESPHNNRVGRHFRQSDPV